MRPREKLIYLLLVLPLLFCSWQGFAQNTVTSGNWSDPGTWSTGSVPTATATVNVNHPLILDQNINITTGTYNFFADVTDLPGGTFVGSGLDNSTLIVRAGATLILGSTTINNNASVTIEAGGTLIINGDLTNNNNGAGLFTVAGTVFVNGDYIAPVGSVEVSGGGNIFTTGTVNTNGSSSVFGSTSNCTTGPCSGQNLCNFTNTASASQLLCSSSTPASLTGSAVPGSPVYLWESSTTSATTGFSNAAGTNDGQNYTPGSLAQTTWFRRKATAAGCTGTSVAVQITILQGGGWLGTTSDWNTASNWCSNSVPTSATDVSISLGVSNMPQITAAANCRDLTIGAGASVTINGSNTLSIYGNFTNNGGTFTTNSSTVTFSGTTQQTISGTPPSFNNLTINNSSGSTPGIVTSNFVNVLGTLTMTQGNVNLSGYNLTIGSSAGSPGALSYAAGKVYGSTLTRWFNTPTVAIGNVTGLFPVGSSSDYRPFYVGFGTALSTGGSIRVGHTTASTTSTVSFADGAETVVRRQDSFWNVSTSGITSAATDFLARLEFTALGTVGDVTHLRMTRVNDVVGTAGTNGGTTANPQVNRTGLSLANLTNNFYVGSINLSITPLPVTLVDFDGRVSNAAAELSWSTASEKNFDRFVIERMSGDGGFENIGEVAAKGTSFGFTRYSFNDINVVPGILYYRLKIVDLDNSFEYSKVIKLVYDGSAAWLSLYPNPIVNRQFHLDLFDGSDDRELIVYDQLGRILISGQIPNSSNDFVIPETVPPGICFVKVRSGGKQEVIKVLVQ
jgi:hypothetical protein